MGAAVTARVEVRARVASRRRGGLAARTDVDVGDTTGWVTVRGGRRLDAAGVLRVTAVDVVEMVCGVGELVDGVSVATALLCAWSAVGSGAARPMLTTSTAHPPTATTAADDETSRLHRM